MKKNVVIWLLALVISCIISGLVALGITDMWVASLINPLLALSAVAIFFYEKELPAKTLGILLAFSLFFLARGFLHTWATGISVRSITILIGIFIFLYSFFKFSPLFGKFNREGVGKAFLFGGGAIFLSWGLSSIAGGQWEYNANNKFIGFGNIFALILLLGSLPVKIIFLGIGEELFFRGIILAKQKIASSNFKRQIWVHGLLFGLWHIPVNLWIFKYDIVNLILNTFLQSCHGVIFASLYLLGNRTLFLAALAHGLIDWLLQDLVAEKGYFSLGLDNVSGLVFALSLILFTLLMALISVRSLKNKFANTLVSSKF